MCPLPHKRKFQRLFGDAGALVVPIPGWPVDNLWSCRRDSGEFAGTLLEQALHIAVRERRVPDADPFKCSDKRIIFVVVFIGSQRDDPLGGISDRAGLGRGFSLKLAIDEQFLSLSIVSADNVVPMASLEQPGRFQVGQFAGFGAAECERETRQMLAEDPALFISSVVLHRTDEAAPFAGRINSQPRRDGQLFGW